VKIIGKIGKGNFETIAVCGKEIYKPRWWFSVNTVPICSGERMSEWRRVRVQNNLIHRIKRAGRFTFSKSR